MTEHLDLLQRPREATIAFSDVFDDLPIRGGHYGIEDFDAHLTNAVGNRGRFPDLDVGIGAWPSLGDYGAVLLEQLRHDQIQRLESATESHSDIAELKDSLGRAVVAVFNHAPRTNDHHSNGFNGDEFYLGLTHSGNEYYGQLPFFRGVHARGWLEQLFRIPNDSGLWHQNEQFRSATVTQVRTQPELLVVASPDSIPKGELDGRVAYVDKFGNVRLEVKDVAKVRQKFEAATSQKAKLHINDGAGSLAVKLVRSLREIPEDELGLYFNPSEAAHDDGPAYLELVRRVSDPNTQRFHAYASLLAIVTRKHPRFSPEDWETVNAEVEA